MGNYQEQPGHVHQYKGTSSIDQEHQYDVISSQ
ncbi:MAG: hypothetical protein PWR10_1610 [Halanaerobiales bacterium]|nr:hypothetical protein [Halanaerobiales bacterium]